MTARSCCATALIAALAGCGGPSETSRPPQQRAALPPARAPIEDAATRLDRFCGALARIIDAEPKGFGPLRGPDAGERRWDGAVVPAGLRSCAIEGDYFPGAAYVCRGEAIAGGPGDLLLVDYRRLAGDVDACLQRPIWYPRIWRQGQDFAFAGGERQVIWRDGGSGPKPRVALKIEEDLGRGLYFLRLAVASDR
jgi:hypothetical protein